MKQSKLRRRRVWRYAVLYFTMLVIFIALLVGPILAGGTINTATSSLAKDIPMKLLQPIWTNGTNNNTGPDYYQNGSSVLSGAAATDGTAAATAKLVRLF